MWCSDLSSRVAISSEHFLSMNRANFEIRISPDFIKLVETNSNIKFTKFKTVLNIRIYDFEFVSNFGFRYSDFINSANTLEIRNRIYYSQNLFFLFCIINSRNPAFTDFRGFIRVSFGFVKELKIIPSDSNHIIVL